MSRVHHISHPIIENLDLRIVASSVHELIARPLKIIGGHGPRVRTVRRRP